MSTNSTSTDTGVPTTSSSSSSPTTTSDPPSSSIANSSPPPVSTSSPSSSPSTSSILSTSSLTTSSSTTPTPTTSSTPTPTTSTPISSTPIATTTQPGGATITVFKTSTQGGDTAITTSSTSSTSSGAIANSQTQHNSTSSGLGTGGTIAVAVVVPIVVVALLVLAGIFLWRKRKARKDAEELRRKEVEEYGYNPNNDPTLPAVGVFGAAGGDGAGEMREDGSSGYRGWGTTAVASSGRKASTTVSGGQSAAGGIGMAYSEGTSPTHGPVSDTRSDNPLMEGRPLSPEQEALGAMGPAASANRAGEINRGPSNASSSYSAANRSDGSGENVPAGAYYSNQYDTGNPYGPETAYGSPPGRAEMSGQPVIRDVQARRNTRIENPSHFPQQSAGISQNF